MGRGTGLSGAARGELEECNLLSMNPLFDIVAASSVKGGTYLITRPTS
jgi:hypothetical protein